MPYLKSENQSFGPGCTVGMTTGVMMLTAGLLTGCLHMRSTSFTSPQNLRLDSQAYPIVHHTITEATYHLDGLTVSSDGGVISGETQSLGPGHQTSQRPILAMATYTNSTPSRKTARRSPFLRRCLEPEDGAFFSTADIQRVDVYDLAVGRVIASYTSAALATAGVVTSRCSP